MINSPMFKKAFGVEVEHTNGRHTKLKPEWEANESGIAGEIGEYEDGARTTPQRRTFIPWSSVLRVTQAIQ